MAAPGAQSFIFSCYNSGASGIDNLECVANAVKNTLVTAATGLAVLAFAIAGIMYMTSAGDSTKAQRAKRYVIYSLSAIGIIIGFRFLISIVVWAADLLAN
jgi:hypothetical protein